jgi:hypothetical protein
MLLLLLLLMLLLCRVTPGGGWRRKRGLVSGVSGVFGVSWVLGCQEGIVLRGESAIRFRMKTVE